MRLCIIVLVVGLLAPLVSEAVPWDAGKFKISTCLYADANCHVRADNTQPNINTCDEAAKAFTGNLDITANAVLNFGENATCNRETLCNEYVAAFTNGGNCRETYSLYFNTCEQVDVDAGVYVMQSCKSVGVVPAIISVIAVAIVGIVFGLFMFLKSPMFTRRWVEQDAPPAYSARAPAGKQDHY